MNALIEGIEMHLAYRLPLETHEVTDTRGAAGGARARWAHTQLYNSSLVGWWWEKSPPRTEHARLLVAKAVRPRLKSLLVSWKRAFTSAQRLRAAKEGRERERERRGPTVELPPRQVEGVGPTGMSRSSWRLRSIENSFSRPPRHTHTTPLFLHHRHIPFTRLPRKILPLSSCRGMCGNGVYCSCN